MQETNKTPNQPREGHSSVQILKLERNVNCAVMSGMELNMWFLNILTQNMQYIGTIKKINLNWL